MSRAVCGNRKITHTCPQSVSPAVVLYGVSVNKGLVPPGIFKIDVKGGEIIPIGWIAHIVFVGIHIDGMLIARHISQGKAARRIRRNKLYVAVV